jgi:hypothetical protein
MTAFEELKAWCEKHLDADDYKVVPESENYYATIYFEPLINDNNIPCFVFNDEGTFQHSDVCTNDEIVEHIQDYEQQDSATAGDNWSPNDSEPVPTSIGGMMVRKMIEEYERKMKQ